jgi:hypothetical protein
MLSLYKSERFQKEYNDFKTRISRVTDEKLKITLENFLNKLASHARNLDNQHEEMIFSKQMKSMSNDLRDNILEVRKTLDKKLSDWERANNVSRSIQNL